MKKEYTKPDINIICTECADNIAAGLSSTTVQNESKYGIIYYNSVKY
ncbi:MAG: hypothetical protein LUD81_04540 [Clostridiales bacterium]|nr:hypothetical protein [Clostridiales bacterium]